MRWMHLRFYALLAAFGGTLIDGRGVTTRNPGRSMLTGLLANALGWTRSMRAEHQALQDRIVSASVWEEEEDEAQKLLTDYQTAQLGGKDRVWTTRGTPAERKGGAGTYAGAHQRWRDYYADVRMSVVMRLEPADSDPTIDALAAALDHPARPLFIGRKPCLPSKRIFAGWVTAPDARTALCAAAPEGSSQLLAFWPETEGETGAHRTTGMVDERNWRSGLHGGERRICEGLISSTRSRK